MNQRKGGQRLRHWLRDERRSQQWLADQIETAQSNVSAWILGPRPPPLEVAIAIRRVTGISVESWAEPADPDSTTNLTGDPDDSALHAKGA